MIYGIGTDIVKLQRFEQMYHRHGERLVRHVLLPIELELFKDHKRPARFLAMHWAAKEAVVKAMGTGLQKACGYATRGTFLTIKASHRSSGRHRDRLSARVWASAADTLRSVTTTV